MQLRVLWATLLRRWYLLLLTLVVAAAGCVGAVVRLGPSYEAVGAVLILPPVTSARGSTTTTTSGNPYLQLDGLGQVRDIVIRAMSAKTTFDELCRPRETPGYEEMRVELCRSNGPRVTYEALPDATNGAPIVVVTVEANSEANAIVVLTAVMDRAPTILSELQSGLRLGANEEITSTVLVQDRRPEAVHKTQIRAGIVVGGGVLAVGLLLIGLFDGLIAARRARSRKTESVQPDGDRSAAAEAPPAGAQDSDRGDAEEAAPKSESSPVTPSSEASSETRSSAHYYV